METNVKRLLNICFFCLLALPASTYAESNFAIDSYIHGGVMEARDGERHDQIRLGSLGSVGLTYFFHDTLGIRLGAGSALGLVIPSLETTLGLEYMPMGAKKTSLAFRLGARGLLNVGIPCVNEHASCVDEAREERENRPAADAFGPMVWGVVGEAGIGGQIRIDRRTTLGLQASFLVGPLKQTADSILLEKVYIGGLGTVTVRYFF